MQYQYFYLSKNIWVLLPPPSTCQQQFSNLSSILAPTLFIGKQQLIKQQCPRLAQPVDLFAEEWVTMGTQYSTHIPFLLEKKCSPSGLVTHTPATRSCWSPWNLLKRDGDWIRWYLITDTLWLLVIVISCKLSLLSRNVIYPQLLLFAVAWSSSNRLIIINCICMAPFIQEKQHKVLYRAKNKA